VALPKQKIIVVVGPTASGKSEFAVKIAKKMGGEIISADSRQVYKNLDIGTAKVRGRWSFFPQETRKRLEYQDAKVFLFKRIPHHCIDIVSPKKIFTVAEYQQCAKKAIDDITRRGKIPLLVGGTGFWIDATVYGLIFPKVPPNAQLRRRLEKKNANELFRLLQKLDPRRAKTIQSENPRRLIRAIEIAKTIGSTPRLKKKQAYQALWIGFNPPAKILEKKVTRRVIAMINNGFIKEVKNLLVDRVAIRRINEFGFEYRAALAYLKKKITRGELRNTLIRDTLHYARKQKQWFRRNKKIYWITKDSSNPISPLPFPIEIL